MRIYDNPEQCRRLYKGTGMITSSLFKELLTGYYKPDGYLFFEDNGDVVPLVIKNNRVTFYGGKISNEYNRLPLQNPKLINQALQFMTEENIIFRLLSIKDDPYNVLEDSYKDFDVPSKFNWIYEDIKKYNFTSLLSRVDQKRRTRLRKRHLMLNSKYRMVTVSPERFMRDIEKTILRQIEAFRLKDKASGWEGNEELFIKIMRHFSERYELYIRYLLRDSEEVGVYLIVYSGREMMVYFASAFDGSDNNITTLLYLDQLWQGKSLAESNNLSSLDALRGSFSYKKRMGFTPKPLYTLTNDPVWQIQYDDDLSEDEYINILGRDYGYKKSERREYGISEAAGK